MDWSIVLFVVVLSAVSGQIRLPCSQEIRLHCFSVALSTVAYQAWLYGCYQSMFKAAASTVCLTGFPCHFFLFFSMTGFSVHLLRSEYCFGWYLVFFFNVLLQTQYAPEALKSCLQSFCPGSCDSCWA